MNKTLFVMSILFAAACGGKSKGGDTMDPCKDHMMMTCDSMADSVANAMTATGDMPAESVDQARGIMADQCSSMAWSQEIIDCMGMAKSEGEGEQCANMMSEEQRSSLMDAMNMDGGGGMDDGMDGMDEGMDDGMDTMD